MTYKLKKTRGSEQLVDFQMPPYSSGTLYPNEQEIKQWSQEAWVDEQGASDCSAILKASIQDTGSDRPKGI